MLLSSLLIPIYYWYWFRPDLEGKFPCYLQGLNKSRCFMGLLAGAIALAPLDLLFLLFIMIILYIRFLKK